ncbi:unnamed protein product [Adineta ricciae]|uniref:non-specific serine/threonine protein kinase n=2 Tax=Adineta ricciae TaxID=249248 RepID=A0A814Y940_ADIRI|nr:unnamed protein product [Adineta ricciae]
MNVNDDAEVKMALLCAHQLKNDICRSAEKFKRLRLKFLPVLQEIDRSRVSDSKNESSTTNSDANIDNCFLQVSDSIIDEHNNTNRPSLVVFGSNSCGKTAFIQRFLGIGRILPSDIGSITTRIVQLTYAEGGQARCRVYDTNEKTHLIVEDDLSSFFTEPGNYDWEGLTNKILVHVKRPDSIKEETPEFTEWARYFVEISLPSKVLALGIDVYDTPGFLSSNREQILTDNLHELVKRIKPTLVFLYDNATIADTDKSCFLAMKHALGSMERVSVFFLNTKADCISIANDYSLDDDPENVTMEVFQEVLLEKRQKCYELLLRRREMASEVLGRLPNSVTECTCFDICTVPKDFDPWEVYTDTINTNTFRRIVKFTAEAYSMPTLALARDVLTTVNDYFDLVKSFAVRTSAQLDVLRQESLEWSTSFFDEYENLLPSLIDDLMANIERLFQELKGQIITQATLITRTGDRIDALLQDKSKRIQDYIRLAVQEQILKVAANDVIISKRDEVMSLIAGHFQRPKGQRKNELLTRAQQHVLSDLSAEILEQTTLFNLFLNGLITIPLVCTRFFLSLPTRCSTYFKETYNRFVDTQIQKGDNNDDVYKLLDAMDTYSTLSNEAGRRTLAEHYLAELSDKIKKQKDVFNYNLQLWIRNQKGSFNKNIEANYNYIKNHLSDQRECYNKLSNFFSSFAKIECQLLAAIELHKRDGIRPILGEELGRGGFYAVYTAQWHKDDKLAVKKLLGATANNNSIVAVEAHVHRVVTLLSIDHVVPLLYTYENIVDNAHRELWLIMPRYTMSLQQYLIKNMDHLDFVRVVSFALTIATTLAELHRLEIVHRDLKASNVMLNGDDQCYLIDFGTAKFGLTSDTVLGTAPLSPEVIATLSIQGASYATYDGAAADIYSFGALLYEMLPKPRYERLDNQRVSQLKQLLRSNPKSDVYTKPYEKLICRCLSQSPEDRPTAVGLVSDLKDIQAKTEIKPCMVCEERLRSIRVQPCGHKSSCAQCWETWSRTSGEGVRCIICKMLVAHHTQDDINATYLSGQHNAANNGSF